MLQFLLMLLSFAWVISVIWLFLIMISPVKFCPFIKPETSWKRFKAIGGWLVLTFVSIGIIGFNTPKSESTTAFKETSKVEQKAEKKEEPKVEQETKKEVKVEKKEEVKKELLKPIKSRKMTKEESREREFKGYYEGVGVENWECKIDDGWFSKTPYIEVTYFNVSAIDKEMYLIFHFYEDGKLRNIQKDTFIVPANHMVTIKAECEYKPEMKNVKFSIYTGNAEKYIVPSDGEIYDPWVLSNTEANKEDDQKKKSSSKSNPPKSNQSNIQNYGNLKIVQANNNIIQLLDPKTKYSYGMREINFRLQNSGSSKEHVSIQVLCRSKDNGDIIYDLTYYFSVPGHSTKQESITPLKEAHIIDNSDITFIVSCSARIAEPEKGFFESIVDSIF